MSAQMSEVHSPFPGMDPYTEARRLWKGLHTQLIGELSTHQLPPLLAPAYFVDAEPSLQIRREGKNSRGAREQGSKGEFLYDHPCTPAPPHPCTEPRPAGLGLAVVEATAVITTSPVEDEEEEESAIFIREATTERLVTVIEILSYSNKTVGVEKHARYLLKRREMLASGVHLDPSPPLTETQHTYIQRRLVEAGLRSLPDEAQA